MHQAVYWNTYTIAARNLFFSAALKARKLCANSVFNGLTITWIHIDLIECRRALPASALPGYIGSCMCIYIYTHLTTHYVFSLTAFKHFLITCTTIWNTASLHIHCFSVYLVSACTLCILLSIILWIFIFILMAYWHISHLCGALGCLIHFSVRNLCMWLNAIRLSGEYFISCHTCTLQTSCLRI